MSGAVPGAGDRWRFYRAVWRWHFHAGLLVLPFIVWLALTGAAYVYQKPIDRWFHRELKVVPVPRHAPLPVAALEAAAREAGRGQVFRYTPPVAADASAEFGLEAADGTRTVVYVDPYSARVLGDLPERGTLSGVVRRLHSLELLGPWGNALIEIAAGWALLLVATGVYLWWPRGRRGGVVSVRGRPPQRLFWRDLHAVTGIFAGGALLFLALTGMPWSVLWGKQVNLWANGSNAGYPAGVRVDVPMSDRRLADTTMPAWSLEQARVPKSDPHAAHGHGAHGADLAPQRGAIGLQAAVARFDALDLVRGYSVSLPTGPDGAYTGSVYPDRLADQRVVHLDQYSSRVLLDMGHADYGALGRGLEWSINAHLGQQYGAINRWALLLACAGILVLCVSGAAMWWKRRPRGSLGTPPLPAERGTLRTVFLLLCAGGLLFPLVGVSLLAIAAVDALFLRSTRKRAPAG